MCVGTASHVGKTVLVAALCRLFARQGYRVSPFKAQNMALNSGVTPGGGEIGRGQMYQAAAAGVEPCVDMNPVLLKPHADGRSQVIVRGRPVGHMRVQEYQEYQAELWPLILASLAHLRTTNDLVIIEGAGSAAEINLREHDIANLRVAREIGCPVLLVGDIDRGGVFAALVGHMELFTEDERRLIRAFVINRFRGEERLLASGLRLLTERTGVPTLGVLPVLDAWRGDEEDSVGLERFARSSGKRDVTVAILRLPYMSNFTDFAALADEPDIEVRFAVAPGDLLAADLICVPGTKSTVADLSWIRAVGLDVALSTAVARGKSVIGICGGYQMLGNALRDPDGIESERAEVAGLGLLDVETTFAATKRTTAVTGEVLAGTPLGESGMLFSGYEIHMGRTVLGDRARPLLRMSWPDGTVTEEGACSAGTAPGEGLVCGTYVHGLFDLPELRVALVESLRTAAGLSSCGARRVHFDQIDRFADHVEEHLDLRQLQEIVGLSLGC
ncbi:MAG: cobyric acid synthase [Thermoleophilia bacterium]